MSRPTEIEVNSASLVDLKAELFRKQEEFNRTKVTGIRNAAQKKVTPFARQNKGVESRAGKDAQSTVSIEEMDMLAESRRKLEAKSAAYERMKASGVNENDDDGERFLVDFQKKSWSEDRTRRSGSNSPPRRTISKTGSKEPQSGDGEPIAAEIGEWVEYTDSLGRTRRCPRAELDRLLEMDGKSRDHYDKSDELSDGADAKRRRIERDYDEDDGKPVGPVHYQHVLGNEIRDHGVGYYRFSTDEETRQDQMKELERLRQQTIESRVRRDRLKSKREEEKQARLDKIRAKRSAVASSSSDATIASGDMTVDAGAVGDASSRDTIVTMNPPLADHGVDADRQKILDYVRSLRPPAMKPP